MLNGEPSAAPLQTLLSTPRAQFFEARLVSASSDEKMSVIPAISHEPVISRLLEGLKYASLLRFDRDARQAELIRSNLKRLYGIGRAPSGTALRVRFDEVDPGALRGAFKRVFAALQRGK